MTTDDFVSSEDSRTPDEVVDSSELTAAEELVVETPVLADEIPFTEDEESVSALVGDLSAAQELSSDAPVFETDTPADDHITAVEDSVVPAFVEDGEENVVVVDEDFDAAASHTTTIPISVHDVEDDYVPSDLMPEDVLEARDLENPSTTAIRRDLMVPQESVEEPPSWEDAVIAPAAVAAASAQAPLGVTPDSLDDAIFEGSTVVPVVPSRAKAHVASLLLGLILLPAAWFLFADASARMLFPANAPAVTGAISWLALAQFAAAVITGVFFVLLTLRSTVGAWVWGVVLTICGLPWLILPGMTQQMIAAPMSWLESNGGVVGANLAHHVQLSGFSGRFFLLGLVLLAMAWVATSVRKRGRAEEALRAQVEKVNPEAAYFTARERRRAAKAARRKH